MTPPDLIVRGGLVFDGTGAPPVEADVAVSGGRVAEVGHIRASAALEIDARGLNVTPGFIDIHSHSDYTLLVDPRAVSAVHQGVTTEMVGNCGHGCFPIRDRALSSRIIYGYDGQVPIDWSTPAAYLERLQRARPAVNVMTLVPNGQLRLATVGLDDRPADDGEVAGMKHLLEEGLDAGAWGYSTGLEYATEQGAREPEITALAATRGPARRHLRDPHPRRPGRRCRRRGGGGDPHRPRPPARVCRSPTLRRAAARSTPRAVSMRSTTHAPPATTSPSTCTPASTA